MLFKGVAGHRARRRPFRSRSAGAYVVAGATGPSSNHPRPWQNSPDTHTGGVAPTTTRVPTCNRTHRPGEFEPARVHLTLRIRGDTLVGEIVLTGRDAPGVQLTDGEMNPTGEVIIAAGTTARRACCGARCPAARCRDEPDRSPHREHHSALPRSTEGCAPVPGHGYPAQRNGESGDRSTRPADLGWRPIPDKRSPTGRGRARLLPRAPPRIYQLHAAPVSGNLVQKPPSV